MKWAIWAVDEGPEIRIASLEVALPIFIGINSVGKSDVGDWRVVVLSGRSQGLSTPLATL